MRKKILKVAGVVCLLCGLLYSIRTLFSTFSGACVSGCHTLDADSLCTVTNDHPLSSDEALSYLFQEFVLNEADSATLCFSDEVDIKQVLWELKYIDKKDFPYDLQVYWSMTSEYVMVKHCDGTYTISPDWRCKSADMNAVVEKIAGIMGDSGNRWQNFQNIRKYVAGNYSYDVTGKNVNFVTAEDNRMTCMGYSTLFFLLCDRYGIPCHILNNETHEWVEVAYLNDDDLYIEYEPQGKFLAAIYYERLKTMFSDSDEGKVYERGV